jgi:hypothetical protein
VGSTSEHKRIPPSVLRTISTMLALAATVILLAGCGGAGHASSGSATVDTGVPISSAQALAYAHTVNLRAADVPGMTSRRNAEVVIYPRGAHPFLRCAGIPAARVLLEIHSTILNAPYWWMSSTVGVLPNEALAAAYVSALGSARGHRCLLMKIPRRADMTISTIAVASPFKGFRITQNTGVQWTHSDTLAFASGRAVVTLTAQGERTPALVTEQRLISLLYSRAKTHTLLAPQS